MKVVSDKFKEVMAQNIRPTTRFQASLEMVDRSVESDAAVGELPQTDFSTGIFDKVHEGDYASFEEDFFRVGSEQRILPDKGYIKSGFVSSAKCNASGVFDDAPTFVIGFASPKSFIAMTYEFSYDYPTEIRVTYFRNMEIEGQFITKPTGTSFVDDENHIGECDTIMFEFLKMSAPNRRLRIARMVFGYEKKFDMKDILSVNHTLSVDPISSSLPYEKLALKVSNFSKDYNPDNPQGTWVYFNNGQPLSIRYGLQTDDMVEWVEAGRLFLSDAPTVDAHSATFEAVDRISTLTNIYNKAIWYEDGRTLYDLAVDVLTDAGVTEYELDDSLREITTRAPLPILSHRECLQMIANAGECILCTNSQGKVVIKHENHTERPIDYHIDFTKVFEKPIVKKTEKLKSVDVKVHYLVSSLTKSELCKTSEVFNGKKTIQVMYDAATGVKAEVDAGEILSETYYARTAFLTIKHTGTVNITVKGNLIKDFPRDVSVAVNDSGEVCPLDNPLITSNDRALSVGKWVGDYLNSRNCYEMNFRQDITLDANDVVYIRSDFEDNIPARITKLQFKLPGQQGAVSVRRVT